MQTIIIKAYISIDGEKHIFFTLNEFETKLYVGSQFLFNIFNIGGHAYEVCQQNFEGMQSFCHYHYFGTAMKDTF